MLITINNNNLLGGREIKIAEHQKKSYPTITHLNADLDVVVLELVEVDNRQPIHEFVLAGREYRDVDAEALTPGFGTLAKLEEYVAVNTEALLKNYLLGSISRDVSLEQITF